MFFTVTTVVQTLTGSLKKKKKDGLKYDKVIRLTSVNNRAFILPKWDCLLNFFHRYFQHSHGSKTENTQRYN